MISFNYFEGLLNRIHFFRARINRILCMSFLFCAVMVAMRVVYTREPAFIFMTWNLFLAFVPFYISWSFTVRPWLTSKSWLFYPLLAVWLLYVPNSFYIITDFCHLYDSSAAPLWFNLILLMSFAWTGLMLGIVSVRHIEKILTEKWRIKSDWKFIYPMMLLNALGVYIGRYLRYNSWDIITNPINLTRDVFNILLHPVEFVGAWSMMLFFAMLLTMVYITLKKINN